MTGKDNLEEKLRELGQALGYNDSLVARVISRINAANVYETHRTRTLKGKLTIGEFVMRHSIRFTAAALIVIAPVH